MPNLVEDKQYYLERYFLTINNPIEKGFSHKQIISTFVDHFKTLNYLCMVDEKGSCFHTHIFVSFKGKVRASMLRTYFPGVHLDRCYASTEDNINYIKKTGKWLSNDTKQAQVIPDSFEEYGEKPKTIKSKVNFYQDLYQMVNDGFTTREIIDSNPKYIPYIDKIEKIRQMIMMDQFKNKPIDHRTVIYVYGPSSVNKLDSVYTKHGYQSVYRISDMAHPFDSYTQEPVIVFDNFSSSITISDIIRYCSKYTTELPCRICNKPAYYNTIYILSNIPLEQQYPRLQRKDATSWNMFLKSINKVQVYDEEGNITEYDSAEDYLSSK